MRAALEASPGMKDEEALRTAEEIGDLGRVETLLQHQTKAFPKGAEIRYRLADVLLHRLKTDEARQRYLALNREDSRAVVPYIALSDIARMTGDAKGAQSYLQKGVEANRASAAGVPALLRLAQHYFSYHDSATAEKTLLLARQIAPKDPQTLLTLARFYRDAKRTKESDDLYRKIIQSYPKNVEAKRQFAAFLAETPGSETTDQAGKMLAEVFQSGQPLPGDFMTAGRLAEKEKDWPEAAQAYIQALMLDSERIEAHYRLTQIYTQSGEKEYAKKEAALFGRLREEQERRADLTGIRIKNPFSAVAHLAEARFAEKTQDYRVAVIAYDLAAQLAPKNEEIRQARAAFYKSLGWKPPA